MIFKYLRPFLTVQMKKNRWQNKEKQYPFSVGESSLQKVTEDDVIELSNQKK